MPTLEQLPQAVSANPEDHVLIEQSGVASVTTVAALLEHTQAKLTLAPQALLGRVSIFPGGPEPVAVGIGLKLSGGILSADTASIASIASPVFTGRPTAPTQAVEDSTNALATTEFVQLHTAQASPVMAVAGRTGYVQIATTDVSGLSKVGSTGAYADLSGIPTPFTLPVATPTALGGVKAGTGIVIGNDGTAALANPLPTVDSGALTLTTGTGTLARSLAVRASDRINVLDFPGAATNGIAVSTGAINAAIAAASARPGGGEVWLPAGRYRIDTAIGCIRPMSNVVLRGAGRGRTLLLIDDTNGGGGTNSGGAGITNAVPATTLGALASVTGGSFLPIVNFQLRDLSLQGLRATLPSNGVHLTNINSATNVVVRDCEFLNSRMFSLLIANSNGVSVQDCRVDRSSRDSIALWDCTDLIVTGNHITFSGDDAISLHSNDATPGPVRSGILVSNNVISDSQGIVILGAKMATISNNVIRRAPVYGIYASAGPAFRQGSTTTFALQIINNAITDVFDASGWITGANLKAYIWIGGPRRAAGTLPSAPGTPVPGTGVVTPLYGNGGSGAFYANNQSSIASNGSSAGSSDTAAPGNYWVRVEGNTLARTLPAVSTWSEWGYGTELPVGNGIIYNGPVTDTMQQGTGISIEGPLYNSRIAGNIIQTGARRAIEFSSTGLADMDYDGLVFEGNHVVDFWEFGVFFPGSTSQRIRFERNVFDSDPYFKATARGPGGTWKTPGPPIALYMPFISGVQIIGNHFRNMYGAYSSSTGQQMLKDNVIHCDPVVVGYSTANRGVANVPAAGPSFSHVIENGDPTDANVGRSKSATLFSSSTQPFTGTYVAGHFVSASSPAVINGQTLMGWKRLTTGSSHVVGTDWVTVYGASPGSAQLASPAFTGTPTAPTPATSNVSSQIATTSFVAASLAAPPSIGSVTPGAGSFASLQAGTTNTVFSTGGDPNGSIVLGRYGTGAPYIEFLGNGLAAGNTARLQADAVAQLSVSAISGPVTLNVVGQLRATTIMLGGANVATQPWVQSQSFVTTASLAGLSPVQAVAGRTGVVVLTVSDVAGAEATASKGAVSGYAGLDASGRVPAAQLPIVAVSTVAGRTGAITLAVADVSGAQAISAKGVASGYAGLDTSGRVPTAQLPVAVSTVAGRTGAVSLAVTDVTGAEATANKGVASGYAALDATGKVPTAQLPAPVISTVAGRTGAVTLAVADVAGAEAAANKGIASGYAALDAAGKVPTTQLPVTVSTVAGRTGTVILAVADVPGAEATGNKGIASGYAGLDATGKVPAAQLPAPVISTVAGRTGVVTLAVADVAGAEAAANKGNASGYAALDSNGKVPTTQLPAPLISTVSGRTGAVTLAVADVTGAEATVNKGAVSGYAALDATGKVPTTQLPVTVSAVAGRTGAVTLAVADVSGAEATANKGGAFGYAGLDATGKVPAAQLPAVAVSSVAGRTGAITLAAADVSGLAAVAVSGAYGDLSGRPSIPVVPSAGLVASSAGSLVATSIGSGLAFAGGTLSVSGVPLTASNLSEYTAGAATARANLGLGSVAIQAASAVAISGGVLTGLSSLMLSSAAGSGVAEGVFLGFSAPAGKSRQWFTQSAGSNRWAWGATSTAETGSNVGSDFSITRFSDAGAAVDNPFIIMRGTGTVQVNALTIGGAVAATQTYVSSRVPAIPNAGLIGGNGSVLSGVTVSGNLALSGSVLSSPQVLPVIYTGNASNVAIPTNAQSLLIQMWGPGGGGGGAIKVSVGTGASGGGGGGGGGYVEQLMTIGASSNQVAVGSTLNITVPAGGVGGLSSSTNTGNLGQVASGATQVTFSGGGNLSAYQGGAGAAGQQGANSGGGGGGSPGGQGGNGAAGVGGTVAAVGGGSAGGGSGSALAGTTRQGGSGGGGGNGSGLSAGAGGASIGGGAGGGAGGGITTGGAATALGFGGAALPNLTGASSSGAAGAGGQFGSGGSGGAGGLSNTGSNGLPGGVGGFPGGGGGGGGATNANLAGGNAGGAGGNGLVMLTWFFGSPALCVDRSGCAPTLGAGGRRGHRTWDERPFPPAGLPRRGDHAERPRPPAY